jgi:hypothetical protein
MGRFPVQYSLAAYLVGCQEKEKWRPAGRLVDLAASIRTGDGILSPFRAMG